VFIAAVVFFAI